MDSWNDTVKTGKGVFIDCDNYSIHFNDTLCLDEFSMKDLFHPCQSWSFRAYLAQASAGFAACMMLPTVTFGTVTVSLLAYLLAFHIRRPGHMHIYAAWISLFDLFLLTFGGYFHSMLVFGAPWWASRVHLFYMEDHLSCKFYQFICDFIQSGKNLLAFLMTAGAIQRGINDIPVRTRPVVIHLQILVALSLSLMISAFAALVFGLHQRASTFMCAPDPQFSSAIHRFYGNHYVLFVDGLLPNLGTISMLWLVRRRLREVDLILTYMNRINLRKDIASLAVCCVERRLLDWVRNYRILLYQIGVFSLTRLLRCAVRSVDAWLAPNPGALSSVRSVVFAEAIQSALINGPLFVEIVVTSFPFIIWYALVPQIRVLCHIMWLRCTCRKTWESAQKFQHFVMPFNYLEETLAILQDRHLVRKSYKPVLTYIRNIERQFRLQYDTYYSLTHESQISWSSLRESSTTFSFSSAMMSASKHGTSRHDRLRKESMSESSSYTA